MAGLPAERRRRAQDRDRFINRCHQRISPKSRRFQLEIRTCVRLVWSSSVVLHHKTPFLACPRASLATTPSLDADPAPLLVARPASGGCCAPWCAMAHSIPSPAAAPRRHAVAASRRCLLGAPAPSRAARPSGPRLRLPRVAGPRPRLRARRRLAGMGRGGPAGAPPRRKTTPSPLPASRPQPRLLGSLFALRTARTRAAERKTKREERSSSLGGWVWGCLCMN